MVIKLSKMHEITDKYLVIDGMNGTWDITCSVAEDIEFEYVLVTDL